MTKKNAAAQALRAIPSEKRTAASRANGKNGGRPRVRAPKDPGTVLAHPDGTVSFWNAAERRWYTHVMAVTAKQLASLPTPQRTNILKLLARG